MKPKKPIAWRRRKEARENVEEIRKLFAARWAAPINNFTVGEVATTSMVKHEVAASQRRAVVGERGPELFVPRVRAFIRRLWKGGRP